MSFTHCRTLFILGVVASIVFPIVAAPPEKPNDRQIARWIKELGNEHFGKRENASRQLWLAGEAAEAALEKALQSGDPEVVRRARALLDKFRWGIYPDTPAEVVDLIQTYQSSTGEGRRQTLEKLLQDDPAGLRAVLKLAEAAKDPGQRKSLNEQVSRKLLAAFQRLAIGGGDRERFDAFITFAYNRSCVSNNNFVAYTAILPVFPQNSS